jgi:hypothetical protein
MLISFFILNLALSPFMCVRAWARVYVHIYEQNNGNNYRHYTHFFINVVLDHLLPSTQPQSFFEWTRTSFGQSLAEIYTILLEEQLQVALEILELGICSSL